MTAAPGSVVDALVRDLVAIGDPGRTPTRHTRGTNRLVSYARRRLWFIRDEIEWLPAGGTLLLFVTPADAPSFWVRMTRREFETTFGHILKTRSWRDPGEYHYSKFPKKARPFVVADRSTIRVPEPAGDVRAVLARLDAIVEDARASRSRLGYFAALYRRVTRRVAQGIAAGAFDDGPRMDRLDTDFANRYFAALAAHLRGQPAPSAWGVSFDAADDDGVIVLQHLLLGVNAHINVDLGAATAAVAAGSPLDDVRGDFDRISEILSDLTDEVQSELGAVSPRIADVDLLGGGGDERLAVFSMDIAREDAWRLARTLAAAPRLLRPAIGRLADEKGAMLARLVAHPPGAAGAVIGAVRAAEETDVRAVIDVLARE